MANELVSQVSHRISEMKQHEGLQTPPNYSVGNALNSAYLTLQETTDRYGKSVLETCTKASISQALLNMAIQGLSPSKNQCYFIAYGPKLTMQPSYFGNVTALKRLENVKDVKAQVIFEGDEFEVGSDEDFNLVVKKFNPKFQNRNNKIVGAFAVITRTDDTRDYTIMTMDEIQQSWNQTRQKNNKVQQNFGQEMAQRTVLNRAAKFYVNTSDDSDLLAQAINQTTADQYEDDDRRDVTEEPKTVDGLLSSNDEPAPEQTTEKKEVTEVEITQSNASVAAKPEATQSDQGASDMDSAIERATKRAEAEAKSSEGGVDDDGQTGLNIDYSNLK